MMAWTRWNSDKWPDFEGLEEGANRIYSLISSVCMPSSGIAGSYGSSFSIFLGISTVFSIVAVLVCIPTNSERGFPFLHTNQF